MKTIFLSLIVAFCVSQPLLGCSGGGGSSQPGDAGGDTDGAGDGDLGDTDAGPDAPPGGRPTIALEVESGAVVDASPLTLRGQVSGGSGALRVIVASEVVEPGADGSFEADVALREGVNTLSAVAVDGVGARGHAVVEVVLDTIPPELTVEAPAGDVVNAPDYAVSGRVSDATAVAVTVGDLEVPVDRGAFTAEVTLDSGANSLAVVATDAAGNTTTATLDVTLFVSEVMRVNTEGGALIHLPEGALTRPDETLTATDLLHANIQNSLGPDGDEIVATVPAGGLTEDVIVIPGALAMTFDGADLPDVVVNGMPSFSVPAQGLSNDMPLWILQLVPDTNGDGLPELRLASQARVSEDGLRIEPVPPPEGSALPGFQFRQELGFSGDQVAQVDGLDHSSVSFIACCCGMASVPIEGDTHCDPGPTAKRLIDTARRIADGKRAMQGQLQRAQAERRHVVLDQMLGVDGSLTEVFELIGGVALAGLVIGEAAAAEVAGASQTELVELAEDILGSSPPSSTTGFAWAVATELYDTGSDIIDRFNADMDQYIALTIEMGSLNQQIEHDDIQIEGLLAAAHTFSGCSVQLENAAAAADAAIVAFGEASEANDGLREAAERGRTRLAVLRQAVADAETATAALEPIVQRLADGSATEADAEAFRAQFAELAGLWQSASGLSAALEDDLGGLTSGDATYAAAEPGYQETLTEELGLIGALPASDGLPKGGIEVSLEGLGQHHDLTSDPTGHFVAYDHSSTTTNAGGSRVVTGGDVSVVATLGALSNRVSTTYDDVVFPGAGSFEFSLDVGVIAIGLDSAGLVDSDGDGIEDGAEALGGTDDGLVDSDNDGFSDLEELLATSDPLDRDSVPGDDADGDGLADDRERELGTDPAARDTDGDGLTDGSEVDAIGSDPTLVDSDDDGFTDYAEVLFGSDPNDAASDPGSDRDGDGIHDIAEPDYGTDPDDADSDDDGIDDAEEVDEGVDGYITDPNDRDTDRDRFADAFEIERGSDPTDPTSTPSLEVLPGCEELGCEAGQHDGGAGVCVTNGTCSAGFTLEDDGACAGWTATFNMLPDTAEVSAAVLSDGTVVASGGYDSEFVAVDSTWLLDPATSVWSAGPAMGTARVGHTLTVLEDDSVLAVGGADDSGAPTTSAELLPAGGEAWEPVGSMTTARSFHGAVLLDDGRVLVAGNLFDEPDGEVYALVEESWTPVTLGLAFAQPQLFALPDGTVLLTGDHPNEELFATSVATWDPENTAAGAVAGPVLDGQRAPLLLRFGARVVAAGGLAEGFVGSTAVSVLEDGAWTPLDPLPVAIFPSPAGALLDDGTALVVRSDVTALRYAPGTDTWTSTVVPSSDRNFLLVLPLPDARAVALGESLDGSVPAPEVYRRGCH